MTVLSSDVFAFIEREKDRLAVIRCEVSSAPFLALRHTVRCMVNALAEAETQEALDVTDSLRVTVSEMLTTPVPFDDSVRERISDLLGEPSTVAARWGSDFRQWYEQALGSAEQITHRESEARLQTRWCLERWRADNSRFRIYCHRSARKHFASLLSTPLPPDVFLHSVRDYRDCPPFEMLLKVGPLRVRGWGAAPDALVNAPRFHTLVQIRWAGSHDDADFGVDPVCEVPKERTEHPGGGESNLVVSFGRHRWSLIVANTKATTDPADIAPFTPPADLSVDDLQVFSRLVRRRPYRPAILVQIDDDHGLFYTPHSDVLSYAPGDREISYRRPDQTLREGMVLVRAVTEDVDLGSTRATHGFYSAVWKERLRVERVRDEVGLINRLQESGVHLVYLRSALVHWSAPPGSVIHAPQQLRHFELLVKAIGLDRDGPRRPGAGNGPWWKLAWAEIRRSRGEAIQAGVLEREVIDAELLDALQSLVPEIAARAPAERMFHIPLPAAKGIRGEVTCFGICGIDTGYRVPDADLRQVIELRSAAKWRD